MTILVVLLGMMVGIAWFLPEDQPRDVDESIIPKQD